MGDKNYTVEIHKRRSLEDPDKMVFQADIYLENSADHHAIGDTPQQALARLATYWEGVENAGDR